MFVFNAKALRTVKRVRKDNSHALFRTFRVLDTQFQPQIAITAPKHAHVHGVVQSSPTTYSGMKPTT